MKFQVKSEPTRLTVGSKNTPKSTCDVVDENGNQAEVWFWGHKPIHDGDIIDVAEVKEETYKNRIQRQLVFAKGMYPDEGGGGGFGGGGGGFGSAPSGGGGFGGGAPTQTQAAPAQAQSAPAGYSVAPDKHADILSALVQGCYQRLTEGQGKLLSDLAASEINVAEFLAREACTNARSIYIALDRSGKLNSVSDAELEALLSTIPF